MSGEGDRVIGRQRRATAVLGALAALAPVLVGLAGCASIGPGHHPGRPSVVASTDVWGDVARQVGGADVTVTSVIDTPGTDPHEVQAGAPVALALADADLVVANGGGYDDFVQTLLAPRDVRPPVIDAVATAGDRPGIADNEHVWFDLPTVRAVADRVATALAGIDPPHAASYAARAARFDDRLAQLEHTETAIASTVAASPRGRGVVVTEALPLYLTAACGLVDRTPPALRDDIENGTGVPPELLAATLDRLRAGGVRLLAYNTDTSGRETDVLRAAARAAGVPQLGAGETLPAGTDYLGWVTGLLTSIRQDVTP